MDRAGWAGGLAGGHDLALGDQPVLSFGGAAGVADALQAVVALLHHAAAAHGHIGIVPRRQRLAVAAIGLRAGIGEPVEAADLVRTVGLAEPRADAAVV